MRIADARLTLGLAAVHAGELEGAVEEGVRALRITRRSLPFLLLYAGELERRYPHEDATEQFRDALRTLR